MESPFVRRLRGALVEESVKSGMKEEEAEEKLAVALRLDIVQAVRDCITLGRGRPAITKPVDTGKKPSK